MPTCTRSASASVAFDSAGSRVFRVPELVSIIIDGWTQPELARVAGVNRIVGFECGRVLYKSPWIDQVKGSDSRMDGLARAIANWSDHFTDLGLGFDHLSYDPPSQDQLSRLFGACPSLSQLELAGTAVVLHVRSGSADRST